MHASVWMSYRSSKGRPVQTSGRTPSGPNLTTPGRACGHPCMRPYGCLTEVRKDVPYRHPDGRPSVRTSGPMSARTSVWTDVRKDVWADVWTSVRTDVRTDIRRNIGAFVVRSTGPTQKAQLVTLECGTGMCEKNAHALCLLWGCPPAPPQFQCWRAVLGRSGLSVR